LLIVYKRKFNFLITNNFYLNIIQYYIMLSSLSNSVFGFKYYKSLPSITDRISVSISGTNGVNYLISTENTYTYYSIASDSIFSIDAVQNLGADIFIFAVGGGGGGGVGNTQKLNTCHGGRGGGMSYGKWLANSTDTLTCTIGSGSGGGISTQNGRASTPYPVHAPDTTVTSTSTIALTAYGGDSGTWNNSGTVFGNQDVNPSGSDGTVAGLTSSGVLSGGLGGESQGTTGGIATSGSLGNKCPLTPFTFGYYDIHFGCGGGGGANEYACEDYSAPFSGSGHTYLSQEGCAEPHATYNYPVIPGVTDAVSATASYRGASKANDDTYYYGRASSNSGAGGGSSQAQGWGGNGGSGIVVLAIKTNQLY
jgi:hypothetical protein